MGLFAKQALFADLWTSSKREPARVVEALSCMADHSECADVPVPKPSLDQVEVAMAETCKEVPAEEYVVHVEEATDLHTRLLFSLLASSWLPRPVGVCLWSVLHAVLAVYIPVMFLALFFTGLVLAIFLDALLWSGFLYMALLFQFFFIPPLFLGISIVSALVWTWLVISCQCCTMAGRSPGQSLGSYILFVGRKLDPYPQPDPVEELGPAARPAPGEWVFFWDLWAFFWDISKGLEDCVTVKFFKHVKLVSFPYWRPILKNYCQEIVPLYDTVVI